MVERKVTLEDIRRGMAQFPKNLKIIRDFGETLKRIEQEAQNGGRISGQQASPESDVGTGG